MIGILVHGNNHFILSGPAPDERDALALARHFSLIQIGAPNLLFLKSGRFATRNSAKICSGDVRRCRRIACGTNCPRDRG